MIPAGTQILCTKRHPIGVVAVDIADDGPAHPRWITFERGQQIRAGGEKVCQVCGRPWAMGRAVYTADGWVPGSPAIERVPPRELRHGAKRERPILSRAEQGKKIAQARAEQLAEIKERETPKPPGGRP